MTVPAYSQSKCDMAPLRQKADLILLQTLDETAKMAETIELAKFYSDAEAALALNLQVSHDSLTRLLKRLQER